jgi:2-C-methyl-D-erythritol 4-phosphate cytidylyltransferase
VATALLVAAGRGERLGLGQPKALAVVLGRPLLEWSLEALRAVPRIERIVVALPDGVEAPAGTIGVRGGAERSHSVRNALAAAPGAADEAVLVHDAARPLLTAELAEQCLDALDGVDAAIAAAPVTDTTKEAGPDRLVTRTLDRASLWAVQTPQVFRRAALDAVMAQPDDVLAAATDDASLVEAAGGTVRLVPAPRENLKVTTPLDLRVAELLLADRGHAPGP